MFSSYNRAPERRTDGQQRVMASPVEIPRIIRCQQLKWLHAQQRFTLITSSIYDSALYGIDYLNQRPSRPISHMKLPYLTDIINRIRPADSTKQIHRTYRQLNTALIEATQHRVSPLSMNT